MSLKGVPGPHLARRAHAAIKRQRIVRASRDDGSVEQSTAAAADAHIGVADRPAAAGETVDVQITGACAAVFGAAVAEGAPVKSDADGRAVAAAAGERTVGVCLQNVAAANDVGLILIGPGTV